MPLYLTGSHSSRVQKPSRASPSKRSLSLPLAAASRTKALTRTKNPGSVRGDDGAFPTERLDTNGKTLSTVPVPSESVKDVMGALKHVSDTMFCDIPDRAGMNSTRIAEVLNFQKNLPPLVSLAHLHALISASSKVERETTFLLASGRIRKIKVVGRGNNVSGLSEVLIATDKYEELLGQTVSDTKVVESFCSLLKQNPRATSISSDSLSKNECSILMHAGFLVSSSLSGSSNTSLSGSSLVAMPSISRAASGSVAAVGGDAAFEQLGGVGTARRSSADQTRSNLNAELSLSVPNIGTYLRLLSAARSHLLELLEKSTYREMPLYLLKERWEGAVDSNSRTSNAKRLRGEFSTVLAGKTKKWKDLNGVNFEWALEECFGAGLVELFETHSVGLGIRALS